MKKRDIEHIKRNFKQNNDNLLIYQIGIYYVDAEKKVVGKSKKFCELRDMKQGKSGSENYWDLAEETKFLEIMKKSISGSIGQTLQLYKLIPSKQVEDLQKLMEQKMSDDVAMSYANYIASSLEYTGNYAIMLTMCELTEASKDSRGWKTTDDDLCDGSNTHSFMMASICPMNPVEIGLFYNKEKKEITHWMGSEKEVGMPVSAFLYPAIEDGIIDENTVLVYNKDKKKPLKSLVENILGQTAKNTPAEQKKIFEHVLKELETENKEDNKEIKATIKEKLYRMATEDIETEDPISVTGQDIKNIITECGYDEEKAEEVCAYVEEQTHSEPLIVKDIVKIPKPKYQNVTISIPEEKLEYAKPRMIDGKKCLVIPLDENLIIKGLHE